MMVRRKVRGDFVADVWHRGGDQRNGMTLVEILLAVTFLSLGLVMMLTAISRCLAVLHVADRYHKAMWALSAGEADYPIIITSDTEPDDFAVGPEAYGSVDYMREVEDPDVDAPDADLRLIIVKTKLSWEGRGRLQEEVIPRYVLYREQ